MWKPMLPTQIEDLPEKADWIYEIKYDGFRCGLEWTEKNITLWSRNGKDFTRQFPEIVSACSALQKDIQHLLPVRLDGELAILRTPYQANFSSIQTRGRMRAKDNIQQLSEKRPASFICFDILTYNGESLLSQPLKDRQQKLAQFFQKFSFTPEAFQKILSFTNIKEAEKICFLHQGEGLVAKSLHSAYEEGKRTRQWLKWKNYRTIQGIISGWNPQNDYFDVLTANDQVLGKVKNGFQPEEKKTLTSFIMENGKKADASWKVPPSVCIDIHCLDAEAGELREPVFHQFRFDLLPSDCTEEGVKWGLAQLPGTVELTKPEKELFPGITKLDYLVYLRGIAPFLLPRLADKRLTMIRYPDGVEEHSFYQKHVPDYAPDFVEYILAEDGEKDVVCNSLESLLWFGNHGALEFHVPFQTTDSSFPDEMVFDLDPPSLDYFSYAVKAAHLIREMVEDHGFTPYVKTSGKTGLQIHIPLEKGKMTYEETRHFMKAAAEVLIEYYPDYFTAERLKKNRGNRLYIDYVQHAEGKTIIAPYSTRATKEATVAAPLFWEEVNDDLDPKDFTIKTVPKRILEKGCPFSIYGHR